MNKSNILKIKDTSVRTIKVGQWDYICITDIARLKNPAEPKDVVKNWMRVKNTIEYLGLWEMLHNPNFKGVEFDPLINHIAQQQMQVLEDAGERKFLTE